MQVTRGRPFQRQNWQLKYYWKGLLKSLPSQSTTKLDHCDDALSLRVQTTLNHISICFYHNIKDNQRNLCQALLTIENSDLKAYALHYANELVVRVRLSFQKLLQTRSTCRNNKKKCLGKEWWHVLVVDKSTDHAKPHFDLFFISISTSEKTVFQSANWKRHCAINWREQRGMDFYRKRQSSQSDREISSNFGKNVHL